MINEICAATPGQSDALGDVNVAIAKLDQTTQRNTSMVAQSAVAAEGLREAISVFGVA